MQLLAFGDPHIKPAGSSLDYEKLALPPGTDAIVCTGDVTHRANPDDLEVGREFLERLAAFEVPVICVPGNHDPHEHYETLVDGLSNVVNAHDRVVSGAAFDAGDDRPLEGHSIVGWGCERFDQQPTLRLTAYPSLDPRTGPPSDRRRAADLAAQRLEDVLYRHLTDDLSREGVVAELEIDRSNRRRFETELDEVVSEWNRLDELLTEAPAPTIVCSHVPPYNTALDRHHSVGKRETDLEGLHIGSIALKLALRKVRPIAALSGHSHNSAYDAGIGDGSAGVRPHLLNLDFRGISTVEVDGRADRFSYVFHHETD